jgi:predicted DNA-binding ribbon-helix-helix protein
MEEDPLEHYSGRLDNDNPRRKKKSRRTESITFRLDSNILDKLRQEAERKDISVNTLISQIAKQHTNWHSVATQAGFIALRRPLIMKLVDSHTDEEIRDLARYIASTSNKDFVLLLRNRYNIHSALDVIETWVKISGYPHTHNVNERGYSHVVHSFVIQHDMGRKWSLYLSELYQNLFREFRVQDYHLDLTPNTVAFQVVLSADEEIDENKSLHKSRKTYDALT